MTGRLRLAAAAAAVVGALCLFALSRTLSTSHTAAGAVSTWPAHTINTINTINPDHAYGLDSDTDSDDDDGDGACPGVHVADYGRRHAAYLQGDSSVRALNGSLVFVARGGGLGNRLRAWATAFYLAVLLDRAFFVHWPAPAGGVSVVGTYWEPTGWFDWRTDAAPEPLRQALLAATPHEWRHRAGGPRWDAHTHFAATDFAQTLARPHEAVVSLYDGTVDLLENVHLADAVERWLGVLRHRHAASGQPRRMLQGRLFACAIHLLVRRTPQYEDAVRAAAASGLVPATAWAAASVNATAVTLPAPAAGARGTPAAAVHLRLGDRANMAADAPTVRALASHIYVAFLVTRDLGPPPAPVFLASDHLDLAMRAIPPIFADRVFAQRPSNITIASGLHVHTGASAAGLARTMLDFALLMDAANLVATFESSFSRAAARLAWLARGRNQTAYRVAPCVNADDARRHPACPLVELSKATAALSR